MVGTKSNSGGVENINTKGFIIFSSFFFKNLILYTYTHTHTHTHKISYHCSSIEFQRFGFFMFESYEYVVWVVPLL